MERNRSGRLVSIDNARLENHHLRANVDEALNSGVAARFDDIARTVHVYSFDPGSLHLLKKMRLKNALLFRYS